jgi:hypothetical protein
LFHTLFLYLYVPAKSADDMYHQMLRAHALHEPRARRLAFAAFPALAAALPPAALPPAPLAPPLAAVREVAALAPAAGAATAGRFATSLLHEVASADAPAGGAGTAEYRLRRRLLAACLRHCQPRAEAAAPDAPLYLDLLGSAALAFSRLMVRPLPPGLTGAGDTRAARAMARARPPALLSAVDLGHGPR